MCCFSQPVRHVLQTRILARSLPDGRQRLAYRMVVGASRDLAMVLPLPVPPGSGEDAVRFIDLSGYEDLFADLERAFPSMLPPLSRSATQTFALESVRTRLVVHDVGDFEASFVPSLADFDRLDRRFRLPDGVWEQLPDYADYGFAVFKLRIGRVGPLTRVARRLGMRRLGLKDFHPMAFEFPRRDPSTLFFPTVHVHDGHVPDLAEFAHTLYAQPARGLADDVGPDWLPAQSPIRDSVDVSRAAGLVDGSAPAWRRVIHGLHANADTTLAEA